MSPEVLSKKLSSMSTYLNDLTQNKDITFDVFMDKHYEIERILELLIMTACDIVFHLISGHDEPTPATYRTAFLRAGEIGIIEKKLAENLALSAGLRNILVHDYEEIDYKILYQSIPKAIKDFTQFMEETQKKI